MSFEQFQVRANEVAWLYENETPEEADRKQAFHAAISIVLDDYALEDVDIAYEIALDVAGDGGIDFFFVSEDENPPRIYSIQVKHHATMPKNEQVAALSKMKTRVDLLRNKPNGQGISELDNQRRLDIRRLRNKAVVEYKLLLTAGASSAVDNSDLPPEWHEDLIEWSVEDLTSITAMLNRDTVAPEPNVQLRLGLDQTMNLDQPTHLVHGYINAFEFAKATHIYKRSADILRMNPRLFLTPTSSFNSGMLATLNDPVEATKFHLYNNGITAVAKRVETAVDAGELVLDCSDFQVVNGGQTTETLWKWYEDVSVLSESELAKAENLEKVFVPIRIVETEDAELANNISRFNNSQNAITSADLVANSSIQKQVKSWIEGIAVKPYVYEARRGTWRKLTPAAQQAYKVTEFGNAGSPIFRTLDLKVLAQALLSVTGKPEQAKEQINSWFKDDQKHEQLFSNINGGYQAALVADLYLFASRPKLWATPQLLGDPELRSLMSLSRFYITHLVYEHWRTGGSLNDWDGIGLISEKDSQTLRGVVFADAPGLALKAFNSILSTKNSQLDSADGVRGLTRKGNYKPFIRSWFTGFVNS